jgi:hypothetical protein
MSTKKTIQINPELFKLPGAGNKTRKNREKKELTLTPIVSPNKLKTKLLKRIQDFKKNEIKGGSNAKTKSTATSIATATANKSEPTDEFYNALDFLQKKKKDVERERVQQTLNNRTLKNYSSAATASATTALQNVTSIPNSEYIPLLSSMTSPMVDLDLPFDLREPTPLKASNVFTPLDNNIINMKYKPADDVPYGCLKGGSKPSYRSWIQTRKNYDSYSGQPQQQPQQQPQPQQQQQPQQVQQSQIMNNVRPPTPPKRNTFESLNESKNVVTSSSVNSEREKRLEQIKNKLKNIQERENGSKPEYQKLKSTLETLEPFNVAKNAAIAATKMALDPLVPFDDNKTEIVDIPTLKEEAKIPKGPELKNYIKKTIRRKFTLGRSDKLRKVGVLLKDKQTRKNVIEAQKELKKTNMTDIRKYLRQHGIIKVGSTAPNDVLRNTFEAAMLAGEITNLNKDVLLHNFLNEEQQVS